MSTNSRGPEGPTTKREFEDRLGLLLRRAYRNGVDVEGGWDYRTGRADHPAWAVEIYRLATAANGDAS